MEKRWGQMPLGDDLAQNAPATLSLSGLALESTQMTDPARTGIARSDRAYPTL